MSVFTGEGPDGLEFHYWKAKKLLRQPQWYWHLKQTRNGRVVATGGEGYGSLTDCLHAIDLVRSTFAAPPAKRVFRA